MTARRRSLGLMLFGALLRRVSSSRNLKIHARALFSA